MKSRQNSQWWIPPVRILRVTLSNRNFLQWWIPPLEIGPSACITLRWWNPPLKLSPMITQGNPGYTLGFDTPRYTLGFDTPRYALGFEPRKINEKPTK